MKKLTPEILKNFLSEKGINVLEDAPEQPRISLENGCAVEAITINASFQASQYNCEPEEVIYKLISNLNSKNFRLMFIREQVTCSEKPSESAYKNEKCQNLKVCNPDTFEIYQAPTGHRNYHDIVRFFVY